MPTRDRKFVNPLTQPSTLPTTLPTTETSPSASTLPATETPMLPPTETITSATTDASTLPNTFTFTDTPARPAPRKRGSQAFEQTHERVTWWMDKELKKRFDELVKTHEAAKSTLFNEAIADLLRKYGV